MINGLLPSAWKRIAQVVGLAVITAGAYVPAATAQSWPTRTVRIVVPYGTGGTPDILARTLAAALQERTGQPVIVDNKPGAGGILAFETVKNAKADGHTLVLGDTGQLAVSPALRTDQANELLKDFVPVTQLSTQALSVIVNASSSFRTINDLVAASKASDRGIRYGTSGVGSVHHLSSERLRQLTGANFIHVPYKGLQFSVPALLSGEVDFILSSATPVMSLWKSEKVRILARGSAERSALMPGVPTLRELGYAVDSSINVGVLVPVGTPASVVQTIGDEIRKIVRTPAFAKKFEGQDFTLVGSSQDDYVQLTRSEASYYRDLVKTSGIKLD